MQHDEGSLKKISSQINTRMLIAPTQSYVNYGFAVTMVELHCDEIDFGILMVCNVRVFFAKMPSVHYTPTPITMLPLQYFADRVCMSWN